MSKKPAVRAAVCLAALLLLGFLAVNWHKQKIEAAYQKAYDRGYQTGQLDYSDENLQEELQASYDLGYANGEFDALLTDDLYNEGSEDGYAYGYEAGYDDGYATGYDEGYEYADESSRRDDYPYYWR